jgi:hypothetical protein
MCKGGSLQDRATAIPESWEHAGHDRTAVAASSTAWVMHCEPLGSRSLRVTACLLRACGPAEGDARQLAAHLVLNGHLQRRIAVSEDLVAVLGDDEVVFELHVSDSWCVDAGFDADGDARFELCFFGVEAWPFV